MSRVPTRFLASLLNRPQMIEPAAGAAVLAVLAPDARMDGYDGDATNDVRTMREYQIVNGVAVIPIVGELVHRGSSLRPASGCCSYQAIADQLADAMNNGAVRAILFDIDTPGGAADGCLDLSERIRSYRGHKKMIASINVRATSAGYAIASAADEVVIGKGGFAGSIGVVAYHADISGALEQKGVTVTYLYAGARKIDGAPELPLTAEARAEFQERIDQQYQRFCEVVAANRAQAGLTVDKVKATEAAIYLGEDALKVGLADRIMTIEEAIAMTVQTTTAPAGARLSGTDVKTGEPSAIPCPDCTDEAGCKSQGACTKAKPADEAKQAAPLDVIKACTSAGFPALAVPLVERGLSMSAVAKTLEDVKAIADACDRLRVPKMKDSLAALVASGADVQMARDLATNAAAARDETVVTDTTRAPDQSAQQSSWGVIVAKLK